MTLAEDARLQAQLTDTLNVRKSHNLVLADHQSNLRDPHKKYHDREGDVYF
ncbi:MAG TPA: hypothetical protein VII95_15010 [Terriglobales bacterium]